MILRNGNRPSTILRDEPDEGALDDGAHAAHAVHQAVVLRHIDVKWCRG